MSGDRRMKPSEKLYWVKAGLALIAGIVCFSLQMYANIDGVLVFTLGTLFYMASSELLSGYFKLDRGHGLKVGVGAYVFLWIMVWTLLYTITRTAPV
jgi:hypothetical protein